MRMGSNLGPALPFVDSYDRVSVDMDTASNLYSHLKEDTRVRDRSN